MHSVNRLEIKGLNPASRCPAQHRTATQRDSYNATCGGGGQRGASSNRTARHAAAATRGVNLNLMYINMYMSKANLTIAVNS